MRQKIIETFTVSKTDNGYSIISDDGLTDLELDEPLTRGYIKRNKLKKKQCTGEMEGTYTKTTMQEVLHAVKYNGEIWKVDHVHVYRAGYSWEKHSRPPELTYHLRQFGRVIKVNAEELYKGETA
jgi:hypothetical protein